MKNLTVKTKRILAAVGGAAIVLALLLAVDAVGGDPLSRAWARRAAIAYAEKLYPGQTFTADGDAFFVRPFCYDTQVQSEQSPDTNFLVRTRVWLFTGDTGLGTGLPGHMYYVEQKRNTCWRLEQEAGEQLAALAQKKYGDAFAPYEEGGCPFVFLLCCDPPYKTNLGVTGSSQDLEAWADALALDEPFDPAVLQKVPTLLTACRICEDGVLTAAEKTKALRELKNFVEGVGWSADYYQVRFFCQDGELGTLTEFAASDAVPADEL